MREIGQQVRNIQPHRRAKMYAHLGAPAKIGDSGKIVSIHEMREVTIIVFATPEGNRYAHTQHLLP